MKVYAAAQVTDLDDLDRCDRYPNVLVSYQAQHRDRPWRYEPDDVLLDSGAYSAWSTGTPVDIVALADWAHRTRLRHPGAIIANLDVIPGEPGRTPTYTERLRSAEAGMRNADWLRSQGLPVMEVYHRYEPLTILEILCDRRPAGGMLAVGGLVSGGGSQVNAKLRFCDAAFGYLRGRYGLAGFPRVHGFGLGPDSRLARNYPWSSVDATTWIGPRKYGNLILADGTRINDRGGLDWQVSMCAVLDRWRRTEPVVTAHWDAVGLRFDDPVVTR